MMTVPPDETGPPPSLASVGWHASVLLLNLLGLPLLPFLPRTWEAAMEEDLREHLKEHKLPNGLVWLLPAGRVALWIVSSCVLACTLTFMPPVPDFGLSWWDLAVVIFVAGIIEGGGRANAEGPSPQPQPQPLTATTTTDLNPCPNDNIDPNPSP